MFCLGGTAKDLRKALRLRIHGNASEYLMTFVPFLPRIWSRLCIFSSNLRVVLLIIHVVLAIANTGMDVNGWKVKLLGSIIHCGQLNLWSREKTWRMKHR